MGAGMADEIYNGGNEMTAQIPDKFRYEGKDYDVLSYTGPIAFDPMEHGLYPDSSSTACWRGYWCEYVVKNGRLVMERLLLHNSHGYYPDLDGVSVSPLEYEEVEYMTLGGEIIQKKIVQAHMGHRTYEANMELDYTGAIVLAADFMPEYYIHMGFQRPWAFKDVKELEFEHGKLVRVTDQSEEAEKAREDLFQSRGDSYKSACDQVRNETDEIGERVPEFVEKDGDDDDNPRTTKWV